MFLDKAAFSALNASALERQGPSRKRFRSLGGLGAPDTAVAPVGFIT